MIIKRIKADTKISLNALEKYMRDEKHAAPGEHGPKSDPNFSGGIGFVSDDRGEQLEEMRALLGSYKGEADPLQHWVMSWEENENPTPAQVKEAWQIFLKHQGCEDHQLLFNLHIDTKNRHSHGAFNRLSPEPGPDGNFKIVWDKGTVTSTSKGQTHVNQQECKHIAMAEICARQGWQPTGKARYSWENGQYIRNSYEDTPDQIKMGSRIETWEARSGVKHPKRIMAETALKVIREAGNDKNKAVSMLAAQGIIYSDVNYLDNKGRRRCGGKLTGVGGEEVKISALPKDCRWIAKQPAAQVQPPIDHQKGTQIYAQIVTFGAAKKYIKQSITEAKSGTELFQKLTEKGLIFEQTGKAGGRIRFGKQPTDLIKLSECGTSFSQLQQKFNDFPAYATTLHGSQGKVNGNSRNNNGNGGKDASNIHENTIEAQARAVFQTARTSAEMQEMFKEQGITFARETATDQRTGRNFEFGRLARGSESITLKSLGLNENGKAMFSLAGIDRVFLARDAAAIVSSASSWKEAETMLAVNEISYSRVKTTTASGAEVIVGRLERGGVTSSLGLAGKEFQPGALDARLLPYSEAKTLYEQARQQQNPVVFLAKQGLTVSDIDRIGRVGEKLEPNLKKNDKTPKAQAHTAPTPRPEKSIIPRNINEILDLIAESAQQAAALAAANAAAGRAAWEARAAQERAEQAEKALQDLRASIQHEKSAPTVAAAKEKTMPETTHAPTATVPAGGMSEAEKERERIQNSEKAMQEREREREKEKERMQRERDKARQRQ